MPDIGILTALAWERRAVTAGLSDLVAGERPRTWYGRLGDGATCVVVQAGIGPERARAAVAALPPVEVLVACGCAGALAEWLRPGDLVAADAVVPVDPAGHPGEPLPAAGDAVARWAVMRGFRLLRGPIASSPVVLGSPAAKAALAGLGLVVEMESAAVAGAARARGVPFVGLRVVLDLAAQALPAGLAVVDERTGELRGARVLAALGLRPRLWPGLVRLGRQSRVAERRLTELLAALLGAGGMTALIGAPLPAAAVAADA